MTIQTLCCRKVKQSILFLLVICVITFLGWTTSLAQNGPICKDELIKVLKTRGLHSDQLIIDIEKSGVAFELTKSVKQEVEKAGAYLGDEGLSKLIASIRDTYRPVNPCVTTTKIRIISIPGATYEGATKMKEVLAGSKCQVEVNPRTDANENPNVSEIRFFRESDRIDAKRLASFIKCQMNIDLTLRYTAGYEQDVPTGSFEIWLRREGQLLWQNHIQY